MAESRKLNEILRTPTPRRIIVVATAASLLLSFSLSALWFFIATGMGRFEPAVESLGLLAGIAGLVAERRAAALEQRDQALVAVRNELETNRQILENLSVNSSSAPRREIYQRLHSSAVDAALSSVVLLPRRDDTLSEQLHEWRNTVTSFNNRLSIAEILAFTVGSYEVLRELHELIHGNGEAVLRTRNQLTSLLGSQPFSANA